MEIQFLFFETGRGRRQSCEACECEMMYMEEDLIEQVRANPILYDLTNRGYRNQALRKEAWDNIGENLGRSGEYCKETWNKLRNAYTNALNRRKSRSKQESSRRMPKWTFEDQMSFLPLGASCRPKQDRSRRHSTAISQDETQEHQDDNSNHDDVETVVINEEDHSKPSPLQIANETLSSDQSDIFVDHFQTSSYQEFATPRREIKSKNTKLESTMNELVKVMKSNNQMLSQHFSQNNCTSHDEDEMYFLSLARFVKKLNPAERIRVKGEVSQIIFQAEFRSLPNDGQNSYQRQQQLPSTSQHDTSEQYFSERCFLNPKTEKE